MHNNKEIKDDFWRDDLDGREVMVTIRCITYNHEAYIRDALEGFVNQKTNFRFEAIVHDDASTDGTATIIREYAEKYPSIIKPIFETENQYSKHDGRISRIMAAYSRGKYIAMCEGDDYWTDPFKLQKQVDFLEDHPDYGMSYGKVRVFMESQNKFISTFGKKSTTAKYLIYDSYIPTPTVLIKKTILLDFDLKIRQDNWLVGDYPLWLYTSIISKIHFDNEILAVYRYLSESASHSSNYNKRKELTDSINSIRDSFNNNFNIISKEDLSDIKSRSLLQIYRKYHRIEEYKNCHKLLIKKNFKDRVKLILVLIGFKI